MLLIVLELAIVWLVLWMFITQIFFPLLRGTLIFPIFRREAMLCDELEKVRQKVAEKKLEEEIEFTKREEGV
jgi:hypothetical protein